MTEPITTTPRRRPITAAAAELLAPDPVWIPPTPSPVEIVAGIASGTVAGFASPVLGPVVLAALGGLRDDRPLPDPAIDAGDPGWFGPDSVAWRVHADPALLVAGIAAFTLQSLHPLAMAGVAEHSAFSEDFLGRTRRTAQFVQGVVYGSSRQAERLCRTVYKVHEQVVGVTPDGRPYAANDPDLLHWVHVAEYLTIVSAHRRFSATPMSMREVDRYIHEVARVGVGTGVIDPPRSWSDMCAAVEHHRPMLAIGEYAAAGVGFLDDPPIIPGPAKPIWRALWAGAVASLPPVARRLLRLDAPSTAELAACRVVLRMFSSIGDTPPPLVAARLRLGLPSD
ncbi:MAG: oxygenase MpaB family protein [Aquihabitans sp.]